MRKLSYGILFFFLLSGCSMARPAASDYERHMSYAMAHPENTLLERAITPGVKAHPGQSGFKLFTHGDDALLLRIALIQSAERTLDMQYYSIEDDVSGKLLLEALLRAADRGVRVRILVDDITIKKSDSTWALIDSHPHIELRVFNPFATQDQNMASRMNNALTHMERFTKRMHNKAFIVDNEFAIIGGRNLGDAYFDNSQDFNFRDVDMLAAGPITASISKSFDSFWNSDESFPISKLGPPDIDANALAYLKETLKTSWQDALDKGQLTDVPTFSKQIQKDKSFLTWATAELSADSPAKVEQPREESGSKPVSKLTDLTQHAQHECIIVSPYLVPGDDGVEWMKNMVDRGINVRVLTNSLGSIDVIPVYTGYKRYREAMVSNGVELYEMKSLPGRHARSGRFASSSRASLHSKVFVVDRSDIIIGTMNFDPRSIELNTEEALVIHSKILGQQLAVMFEHAIAPSSSYHMIEAGSPYKHLEWVTELNGKEIHYTSDPKAGFWRRVKAGLYGVLPFENEL